MKTISFVAAATVVLISSQVFAGGKPGWYGQLSLYGVSMMEEELEFTDFGGDTHSFESDPGIGISGAYGYKFCDFVRVEGELAARYNGVESDSGVSLITGDPVHLDSSFSTIALMANAYLDVPTGSDFSPYVGAGAGYVYVRNGENFIDIDPIGDHTYAYQAMAGVSYKLAQKADLVMGYRYFAAGSPEYKAEVDGAHVKSPYKTHNIEIGVRKAF